MERYNGWLIDIEDVTNFWLSDGMVKLKAVITPDVELVYNFLKEKGYVSTDSDNLAIYIYQILGILIELYHIPKGMSRYSLPY